VIGHVLNDLRDVIDSEMALVRIGIANGHHRELHAGLFVIADFGDYRVLEKLGEL